jgi:hypothetical protein
MEEVTEIKRTVPQAELYAVSADSVANVFRAKIQNKDDVPRRFFVEAEVVAEFVQVGTAHFFVEARAGFLAFQEDVFEIKNDLGWGARIVGVFVAWCADEESEDVRIESVCDQGFLGKIFKANRNLACRIAQRGREMMEGLHHNTARGSVVFHLWSRRCAARSRRRAPAAVPEGCFQSAPS